MGQATLSHNTSAPTSTHTSRPAQRCQRPFIMFPTEVARNTSLSACARLLYALLVHGNRRGKSPRKKALAESLGCSARTARACLGELEAAGLIRSRRVGLGRPNAYDLVPTAPADPDRSNFAALDEPLPA